MSAPRSAALVDGQTEAELVWFFNEADGDMGLRSNFGPMVARIQCPRDHAAATTYDADYRQVEAASRDKVIRRALELAGGGNEAVLRAAFTEPQPEELAPLGRLAGIVARLPRTEAVYASSGTQRPMLEWLGRIARSSASLKARCQCGELRVEAEGHLQAALDAYRRGRGKARA